MPDLNSSTSNSSTRSEPFAWQGLCLSLPSGWRPVKIGGDAWTGEVLFADVDRPLVGIRWDTPGRRAFARPDAFAERRMREQVGALSAREATPFAMPAGDWAASLLFREPEPPGRDVWVGLSRSTRRSVEIALHRHRPADATRLADVLLASLVDVPADQPRDWRVFDLHARVPAGYRLVAHKLAAGDLRLTFVREERIGHGLVRRVPLTVRQVRPARLALARRTLAEWLKPFAWEGGRFHRPDGPPKRGDDGHLLEQPLRRRRRYRWLWTVPQSLVARVEHDPADDRLLLLRGLREEIDRVELRPLETSAAGRR